MGKTIWPSPEELTEAQRAFLTDLLALIESYQLSFGDALNLQYGLLEPLELDYQAPDLVGRLKSLLLTSNKHAHGMVPDMSGEGSDGD